MHHEERLENYKNMINKLSDKIDNNVNKFKQFTTNIVSNNPNNTRFSNRYEQEENIGDENNYMKYNNDYNNNNNNENYNYDNQNYQPGAESKIIFIFLINY